MHRTRLARRWPWIATLMSLVLAGAAVYAEDGMASEGLATPATLQTLLANTPQAATPWAGSLVQLLQAYQSFRQAQEALKQLRLQQDATRTELTSVTGTLEMVVRERQDLEKQEQKLETERQQRLNGLRKELEDRLQEELSQARQQIDVELKQDYDRAMQSFESRLGSLIDQNLEQEIQLQEREIQQVSGELETLTEELRSRLGKLQSGAEVAGSVEQSINRTLAQRKAELQARREQLKLQREQVMVKRRAEYAEKLKQQQAVEHQTRLIYKEASLRQAMAELLHGAQQQEDGALRQVKQALEEVRPKHMQVAKRQALLTTRLQALDQQYTEASQRIQTQQAARGDSLTKLEQSFEKSGPSVTGEGLQWFGQVIQESPPEVAAELSVIYHRLNSRMTQERQLREQQKLLRERQLALQVSREMEKRYQEQQERLVKEQQAKSRKADELMTRVRELQTTGRYEEALQLTNQIQILNPALSSQMAILQQDLQVAREQSMRQAKAADVERVFSQAMHLFEQGQYEESVKLFEQVIEKEAQPGQGASR